MRKLLKRLFPWMIPLRNRVMEPWWARNLRARIGEAHFTKIYRENRWGDAESRSGTGSNLVQTESIRRALPKLIAEYGVKSLLDAPCGDHYWMKEADLSGLDRYIGMDIVAELARKDQELFGNAIKHFVHGDLVTGPIPRADMILCRDCLVHLPMKDALKSIRNMLDSGSTFLLTTTFVKEKRNRELGTLGWRRLNLQIPPFNFPEPLLLIDEACTEGAGENLDFTDKCLGLWRFKDLESVFSGDHPLDRR